MFGHYYELRSVLYKHEEPVCPFFYAVVTEVHDALAEALVCHDLYALIDRRRSYQ